MDPIASAGPIKKAAVLLFYGWGYNFYRVENQLRADDLLIRSKVCGILAQARASLSALEAEYRRTQLPAPTRGSALPDPSKFEQARLIARCGVSIENVVTAIHTSPAPTSDFVWLRHHTERGVLEILESIDVRLVDEAVRVHDLMIELKLADVSDPALESSVTEWLKPLRLIVQERRERLTIMV
jgi:hypothetical protein